MKERSLIRYAKCIPDILRYQLITKFWLFLLAWLLRQARSGVLWTSSRSALSSGDIPFMMTTWQGWLVILLEIGMLLLYMLFDVNAMILLSSRVLHQQPIRVREILREAWHSLRYLRQPLGAVLVVYVAFLLPIAGVGLGISLTDGLYIPDFITSWIEAKALYNALYNIGLLLVFAAAVYYLFTFHCMIIGGQQAGAAKKRAGTLMRKNFKNFLKRYGLFLVRTVLLGIVIVAVTVLLLLGIASAVPTKTVQQFRILITFFAYLVLMIAQVYIWLFTPFQAIELTRIYESYTEEDEGEIRYPGKRPVWRSIIVMLLIVGLLFLISVGVSEQFEEVFPAVGQTQIIAHRAGGSLANENTVLGLQKAIEKGVTASEIDVQRTKDGYYVLNHDDTLKRLTGESRSVSQLTLDEIRQLRVRDTNNLQGVDTPVSTFEEILETAKGHAHLYVELKGDTADQQMADDLYRMVSEQDMLDEVTFISLDYPLISYLEQAHPEVQTGYLCYAALGDLEDLDVDELILEEEIATPENIEKIHDAGKKVNVWTVNKSIRMFRFFSRNVDAIITDEIDTALLVKEMLNLQMDEPYTKEVEDLKRVILQTIFVWWP